MTRLNRMFPRIVAAQYEVPAHLSADCCDLISRLMTVDIQSRRGTPSQGRLLRVSFYASTHTDGAAVSQWFRTLNCTKHWAQA